MDGWMDGWMGLEVKAVQWIDHSKNRQILRHS
jgi:hypothetical protein